MDEQEHPDLESTSLATWSPESALHASGMFSHSQHFTVTGGTFNNITNHNYATTPSLPSDLRMVPLGDIDLRHEIRLNNKGVVNYDHNRGCVRRLYSAKIEGRKSTLMVAMYQGNGAEEICGAASSGGIHATLFNDGAVFGFPSDFNLTFEVDLIPLKQFVDSYRDSPALMVYIYACCDAHNYIYSAFQQELNSWQWTKWIRRSTGRLCAELGSSDLLWLDYWSETSPLPALHALGASHMEPMDMATEFLTVKRFHHTCLWDLRQDRQMTISNNTSVKLGAIFSFASSNLLEASVEIASLSKPKDYSLNSWGMSRGGESVLITNDGWTRCTFREPRKIPQRVSYSYVQKRTSELVRCHSVGQPVSDIGLLIPLVWIVLVWRTQHDSDSLLSSLPSQLLYLRGMLLSTKDYDYFIKPKGLIHTARTMPGIWGSNFIRYPLKVMVLLRMVSLVDGEEDADSDRDTTDSESEYLSAHEDCVSELTAFQKRSL
ncbi:hypothetical protein B0H12DRAFT_1077476 [Mycena haematopus]|nr:hypothetical protein B0H12DRAFT_1077476 [Mycena haematopus]